MTSLGHWLVVNGWFGGQMKGQPGLFLFQASLSGDARIVHDLYSYAWMSNKRHCLSSNGHDCHGLMLKKGEFFIQVIDS